MLEEAIKENTIAIYQLTRVIEAQGTKGPRKRRTKKQMEEEANSVESNPTMLPEIIPDEIAEKHNDEPFADSPDPEPETKEEYTVEQLRAEASAVVTLDPSEKQEGLKIAQKIITDLGYKMISEIKPEERSVAIALFKKAVANYGKKGVLD
ncbi:MAG: hypothetical protein GY928_09250 [Colwellia sp.]|nr:hypothetical protein [Colwellia sp.]